MSSEALISSIIVDGREIIQGDIFRYYKGYREVEKKIKSELGIPKDFGTVKGCK